MRRRLSLYLLLIGLLVPGTAFADSMKLPGLDPTDFTLLEAPSNDMEDLSVEERRKIQKQLKIRRKMADIHQVMAFTSAGLIIAAEIFGTINFAALEEGNPPYRDLKGSLAAHRVLAGAAVATYWTTGALSWAMPPAYVANTAMDAKKKKKVDSGDVHAALSVAHGICMGAVMVTGVLMANAADNKAWGPLMVTHLTTGYLAAGLVIGSGIVINTL